MGTLKILSLNPSPAEARDYILLFITHVIPLRAYLVLEGGEPLDLANISDDEVVRSANRLMRIEAEVGTAARKH